MNSIIQFFSRFQLGHKRNFAVIWINDSNLLNMSANGEMHINPIRNRNRKKGNLVEMARKRL